MTQPEPKMNYSYLSDADAINELIIGYEPQYVILPPLGDKRNESMPSEPVIVSKSDALPANEYGSIDKIANEYIPLDNGGQQVTIEKSKDMTYNNKYNATISETNAVSKKEKEKENDEKNKDVDSLEEYISTNRVGQFYFASITIMGLFVLYKMVRPFTK